MPQITIDGPQRGVLTQSVPAAVLWPSRMGMIMNRSVIWGEIKVPSPPTREGRGEGNLRVQCRFWLSQVATSHSCSTPSRREDHLPQILNGVAMRSGGGLGPRSGKRSQPKKTCQRGIKPSPRPSRFGGEGRGLDQRGGITGRTSDPCGVQARCNV